MSEEEEYEDIDLAALPTDELIEQMMDDLYDGLADEIATGTNILLEREMMPYDVLQNALVSGMDIVGVDFRDGILFVPEVLMAPVAGRDRGTLCGLDGNRHGQRRYSRHREKPCRNDDGRGWI